MYTNIKILILLCIFTIVRAKDCFWNSNSIYKKFSSKTPYNLVRGDIRDSIVKLKGCEPISIWTIIRHGKRSPGIDFGGNMMNAMVVKDYVLASYRNGNTSLCAQDVENLRDWKDDQGLFKKVHVLTDEGYQELLGIGRRLREAFGELLKNLEEGSYSLRSAYGHWIENGVDGFVKGLSYNTKLFVENANAHYDIMAPYEACPKYISDVKGNPNTYNEARKYENSSEYIATKQRIQKRIGVQYPVLTNTNITSLYDLCRYTWNGIENKASPWCALFKKEDQEVLEYYGDLRHYYRNGYGTPMNMKFGRIPLKDLFKTFVNAKNTNKRKLTAYFSHATMMDMIYSALGWFKDETPLTGLHRDPNRKWRSSKMSAFAANIVAVLSRCSTADKEDYKVVFYINEEPVTSICENGVCTWQDFENMFKTYSNTTMDFCFT